MTEKLVKESLKKYLKSIGAYYFMPVQMGYGAASIDFLVCHKGKFYGIETKASTKYPTPRQYLTMQTIRDAGGDAWVENSVELELTKEFLKNRPESTTPFQTVYISHNQPKSWR